MADDEPENLTLKLLREMRAEQERLATHAAGRISCGFRSSTSALPRLKSAPEKSDDERLDKKAASKGIEG